MASVSQIAETAALIGDPARANMLVALLDRRALTASELARIAGIAPSTASEHLAKLTQGELLSVLTNGRYRYYRLSSAGVAETLESLMNLAACGPKRFQPRSRCDDALALARTCYAHLAGRLGVAIADGLAQKGMVILSEDGGMITDDGLAFFARIGVSTGVIGSKRAFCRLCLDWSERRWHIGGSLGSAIAARSFELGWTKRQADSRAVIVTPEGQKAFLELFGLEF